MAIRGVRFIGKAKETHPSSSLTGRFESPVASGPVSSRRPQLVSFETRRFTQVFFIAGMGSLDSEEEPDTEVMPRRPDAI